MKKIAGMGHMFHDCLACNKTGTIEIDNELIISKKKQKKIARHPVYKLIKKCHDDVIASDIQRVDNQNRVE